MALTSQQIAEMDGLVNGPSIDIAAMDAIAMPPERTLNERFNETATKRGNQLSDSTGRFAEGRQSPITTALQFAGNTLAGTGYDIAGDYAATGANAIASVTPEAVKAPIRGAVNAVTDTRLGRGLAKEAEWLGQGWDFVKQNAPATADNLEALINLTPAPKLIQLGGRALESAAPQVVKGLVKDTAGVRSVKAPIMSADEIKSNATAAYDYANKTGGVASPQVTENFIAKAQRNLPQDEVARVFAGNTAATDTLARFEKIRGKPITLQGFQEIDESLGDAIDAALDNGRVTKDAKKLIDIQDDWREALENISESEVAGGKQGFAALKEGRALWGAQAKMRDIEKIIKRAELTENPRTSLKTGFRNLKLNDKRMRGYTPEQRAAIEKAADSGIVDDLLGIPGSRLMQIGGILSGNPATAVLTQGGSIAARSARNALQMKRAEGVARSISKDVKPFVEPATPQAPMLALPAPSIAVDAAGVAVAPAQKTSKAALEREFLKRKTVKGSDGKTYTALEIKEMPPEKANKLFNQSKKDLQKAFEAKKGNK